MSTAAIYSHERCYAHSFIRLALLIDRFTRRQFDRRQTTNRQNFVDIYCLSQ